MSKINAIFLSLVFVSAHSFAECEYGEYWLISGNSTVEGYQFESVEEAGNTWCDSTYYSNNWLQTNFRYLSCDIGDVVQTSLGRTQAFVSLKMEKRVPNSQGEKGILTRSSHAFRYCY